MNKINFCNSTENKTLQINVVGGLGNQLFLLVFGVCVSKYLKKDLVIQEKLIHFGSNPNRKLAISNFTFKNLHINYSRNIFFKLKSFYSNKFFRKLIWIIVHIKNKPITEIEIAKSGFKFNSNQTYSGYYQDWFYADLAYEIVGGFNMELSEPNLCYNNLLTELNRIKPICVHVRLGDYLLYPEIFSIIPERYFLNSIEYLSSRTERTVWCFVESADELLFHYPKLAKISKKIIDRQSGVDDNESFALLMNSSKLITSNSTYSLWAAWFAEKKGAKVVVPYDLGIKDSGVGLKSSRWNRYDLKQNTMIQKTLEKETYNLKKRDFERKFK